MDHFKLLADYFFTDCPGPETSVRAPLWLLAVAEKPGPLLEADALPEPLDEPEDEKDEDPLDFPEEPEPLLEPDPEPDADAEMPLPDPEEAAVAGRSLWTQTPSASRVLVPGMWMATVLVGASSPPLGSCDDRPSGTAT